MQLANGEESEEVGEERLAQDKVRVERESGSTRLPLFSRGRSSQSRWIRKHRLGLGVSLRVTRSEELLDRTPLSLALSLALISP